MQLNPWVFMGVGVVASIGSMMGVYYTEPESPAHYASWALVRPLPPSTASSTPCLTDFVLHSSLLSRESLSPLCSSSTPPYFPELDCTPSVLSVRPPHVLSPLPHISNPPRFTGGLCYVGATAESEQFLYIGGPLLAGLGVVLVSSLAPMLMPRMALRTMSIMENVSAYGGAPRVLSFSVFECVAPAPR